MLDPNVHLNPAYYGHVADGEIDLWIDPDFSRRQTRMILDSLDDYDLVINRVNRRKKSDFRVIYKDVVDPDKPNVVGRSTNYADRDLTKIHVSTTGNRKFDRFLFNHEVGHSLGLGHRFDDPVQDTVMNYPTYGEITDGTAATRLTPFDRHNIRNFLNHIQHGTDDTLTGQHFCSAGCNHTVG